MSQIPSPRHWNQSRQLRPLRQAGEKSHYVSITAGEHKLAKFNVPWFRIWGSGLGFRMQDVGFRVGFAIGSVQFSGCKRVSCDTLE